jgi:pimeloyl-ACP methyl ester carboxylesterase
VAPGREQVVLAHGLWLRSPVLRLMARRLRAAGFGTLLFDYKTRNAVLPHLAEQLHQFIAWHPPRVTHLIGHSLGVLVILEMLARYPETARGRVVLLAGPVRGSAVARRLESARLVAAALGLHGQALSAERDYSSLQHEIGVVAGDRPFGLGRLFGLPDEPNDGLVAVSETHLQEAAEELVMPVTHNGLMFSAPVAEQAIEFLRSGHFLQSQSTG